MSSPSDSCIVFDGSSPEDVSHARKLWSSLLLLPPQESPLVSADVHHRLPPSRPQRGELSAAGSKSSVLWRQREERQRYLNMMEQRREILALLRRQREQRIRKELLSVPFKPKTNQPAKSQSSDTETDTELVKQLHF